MIAMRIAARYPALVERLVLVNTSARAEYPDRLEAWSERRAELLAGEAERASAFPTVQHLTTARSWLADHPDEVAAGQGRKSGGGGQRRSECLDYGGSLPITQKHDNS